MHLPASLEMPPLLRITSSANTVYVQIFRRGGPFLFPGNIVRDRSPFFVEIMYVMRTGFRLRWRIPV